MHDETAETTLRRIGAILKGHFILTSGLHSDTYFEKFRILERPEILSRLCTPLAEFGLKLKADVVIGPMTGGMLVALETARQMKARAMYAESNNGVKFISRGMKFNPGERVMIVDDVVTTGTSIFEVIELIREQCEIVGVASLISRAPKAIEFGAPCMCACEVQAQLYTADVIPEWLDAIEPVTPGSRKV